MVNPSVGATPIRSAPSPAEMPERPERHLPVGPSTSSMRMLAEAGGLALILLFALRMRLWDLDAYTGSFDEGIRSQQLLLMSAGYRPFREIFASQGPLLLDLLYPFYALFGETLAAARVGVVVCSMVALAGAWWVGRLAAGPLAGLAATAILALSPTFLEGSRLALAEVPTIAPGLLAIAATLAYRQTNRRCWLLLSAAFCALALLIKPMVVHVGVPLLLILAWPRSGGVQKPGLMNLLRWGDFLLYGAVVAVLCALVVAALGPAQVWDNLGAYRSGAGGALGADWGENLRLTRGILARERAGLFALAAVGLLLGLWRRPLGAASIALWAAAILGMFLLYGDLADKHIVYLVPPLALLAGAGVGIAAEAALGRWAGATRPEGEGTVHDLLCHPERGGGSPIPPGRHGRSFAALRMTGKWRLTGQPALGESSTRVLVSVLGLAALAIYLLDLVPLYRADVSLIQEAPLVAARRRDLAAELDMAEVMQARAGPNEWVLSDNPGAAFRARRFQIPALVDTSGTRIDAGSLTASIAIDAAGRYQPTVVVTWERRLGRLDAFTRWLPANGYRLDRTYPNGWDLYVRA
jgi:hypothetical protein